jgi:Ca2+-binding RTX toxin-like protein
MAVFQSVNLERRADLILGGVGPLAAPLTEKSSEPDPSEKIQVSSTEILLEVPNYNAIFKFGGESISYTGNGDVYGFSGTLHQEISISDGLIRYILSGFSISPIDYFMNSTWETVFSGDDQIYLSNVDDKVNAMSGNDYIEARLGNDSIDAGYGFDTIYGGLGDDTIQGGFNADRIYGEDGSDDLRGGNGLDLVVGGLGNDTIRGAKGTDTLTGGEGSDVFIFATDLDGKINIDTITDFVSGTDRIELSAAIFGNVGAVGSNVGLSQYIKYNAATGVLSYDADGSGAGTAVAFAVLGSDTHPATVGTDFWVVA